MVTEAFAGCGSAPCDTLHLQVDITPLWDSWVCMGCEVIPPCPMTGPVTQAKAAATERAPCFEAALPAISDSQGGEGKE